MFNLNFLNAYSGWGMWFLQFAVGAIFIYHGWPKMKNVNPHTQTSESKVLQSNRSLSVWVKNFFGIGGGLHGIAEVTAAAALILGVYIREAGLVLAIIMLGAIYMKKFKWNTPFSSTNTMGWEFDLVLLGAALYFLLG